MDVMKINVIWFINRILDKLLNITDDENDN